MWWEAKSLSVFWLSRVVFLSMKEGDNKNDTDAITVFLIDTCVQTGSTSDADHEDGSRQHFRHYAFAMP